MSFCYRNLTGVDRRRYKEWSSLVGKDTLSSLSHEKYMRSIEESRGIVRVPLHLEDKFSYVDVEKEEVAGDFDTNHIVEDRECKDIFRIFLKSILTKREITIVQSRFGFNGDCMSVSELSKMFNVSQVRIRQVEAKALRKMRLEHNKRLIADIFEQT